MERPIQDQEWLWEHENRGFKLPIKTQKNLLWSLKTWLTHETSFIKTGQYWPLVANLRLCGLEPEPDKGSIPLWHKWTPKGLWRDDNWTKIYYQIEIFGGEIPRVISCWDHQAQPRFGINIEGRAKLFQRLQTLLRDSLQLGVNLQSCSQMHAHPEGRELRVQNVFCQFDPVHHPDFLVICFADILCEFYRNTFQSWPSQDSILDLGSDGFFSSKNQLFSLVDQHHRCFPKLFRFQTGMTFNLTT